METVFLSVGDKIINAMKDMEIDILGLAALSGVPERILLDVMAGIREADITTLCKVADALGVRGQELCPDEEKEDTDGWRISCFKEIS